MSFKIYTQKCMTLRDFDTFCVIKIIFHDFYALFSDWYIHETIYNWILIIFMLVSRLKLQYFQKNRNLRSWKVHENRTFTDVFINKNYWYVAWLYNCYRCEVLILARFLDTWYIVFRNIQILKTSVNVRFWSAFWLHEHTTVLFLRYFGIDASYDHDFVTILKLYCNIWTTFYIPTTWLLGA